MSGIIQRVTTRPFVAHAVRATTRFTGRLGVQFSAATAYFSVLALVPVVMFAFAATGFVLTVVRPDLLDDLNAFVTDQLGRSATSQALLKVITQSLEHYTSVGVVALVSAAYSGASWMGNLKDALRAQMRAEFDGRIPAQNIVVKTLLNLVTMLGLFVAVLVTFGLSAVSTSLTGGLVDALGLGDVGWLPVVRVVAVAVSLGAGWLLFCYLFLTLPETRPDGPTLRRGALIGAVGLILLQYLASLLVRVLSGSAPSTLFGPVVVLMLFFNLFARLILLVAAWIATADQPAFPSRVIGEGTVQVSDDDRVGLASAVRASGADDAAATEPGPVPQAVAVRSVQVGMGAGYVTGTAAGIGLGALAAYLVQRHTTWRRRRRGRRSAG